MMKRKGLLFGGGAIVYGVGMIAAYEYYRKPRENVGEIDTAQVYDQIARMFDRQVARSESWYGINKKRKQLLENASVCENAWCSLNLIREMCWKLQ
jgi:hypothetical protein